MYRPSTVFVLLVVVTFLLSLVLIVSLCPVAVVVYGVDSTSDLPRTVSVCVGYVPSIIPQILNVDRLARAFNCLSALAAGSHLQLIIVKTFDYLYQLLTLSRSIGRILLCMACLVWLLLECVAEVIFHRTFPYLPILCSTFRIISTCCVYILLCGAPILVFYCVVLDAKPSLELKQEPVIDIPYAVVRRRKLPRMLQERYEREREQALQREAERQKSRLATSLPSKPGLSETGSFEPSPTESDSSHPTKQGDVELTGLAPLPIREPETCNVIIPPSPCSLMPSPWTLATCPASAVSPASTNPSTPASGCASIDVPATPDTEYYEDSSPAEDAALPLSESAEESKFDVSNIAGENTTLGLDVTYSAPRGLGNLDAPSAVQHKAIAEHGPSTTISCPVSPHSTTEPEAVEEFQPEAENSPEKPLDLSGAPDATVEDILATPGMAALIEAAVADLGSALADDIVSPSHLETNRTSTLEVATCIGSAAGTAGSRTPQGDWSLGACLFENNGAGRFDTTITTCPTQDVTASSMDAHMTTEQVDEGLELLDAESARTGGDLAGMDLDLGLGASESADVTLMPPPISLASTPTDADLQALDAMWKSMGINPAEPVHMDIDLEAIMGVDSTVSTTETSNDGAETGLGHNMHTPSEPVAVPSTNNTSLNVTGSAMNCGAEKSDEECLAALAQMYGAAIGTIMGDMDQDETQVAPGATRGEPQAVVQRLESSTPPPTLGAPDSTEWDVSMSDEECIAQLAELCKGITPATNPELDLEQTLAMLSGGSSMEGRVPKDMSGPKCDLVPPPKESTSTSAGPSGCMRLEDVIDFAMVDMSESEDGSEYLATPVIGQTEMDETLAKAGWRCMEACEQKIISPLDMHNGVGVGGWRK
ncbi:hypothetical protein FRC08_000350 [Ceratobasidium sp. 394]|nr:hypothetical protein FRC08_000350 [Ceratobasidium sp. 394]